MTLNEAVLCIKPSDLDAENASREIWNNIAKPLGSLGLLEEVIIKIAGMTGNSHVALDKPAVVVMCADNGVVLEGVTQTDQGVTAVVTENMHKGITSVCHMSRVAGAEVLPVNIGVAVPVHGDKILQRCIRPGTGNMTCEPAMTRQEAIAAIEVGIDVVAGLKNRGFNIIATGEMGIGNTTTSSAMASVLLGVSPDIVTGRGAGLTTDGLIRKIDAIKRAIAFNEPDPNDVLDVLSKVGGLDIAGLAGIFLGAAVYHIPVLIDGFISSVAALAAMRICPLAADYFIASHCSNEPAGAMLLDSLKLEPLIYAKLCLGEGTGAVCAMPLLNMALSVYSSGITFDDINIDAYIPLS